MKLTHVIFNGSKWAGEEPDTIEQLFVVLAREPLDPSFELLSSGHATEGFVKEVSREFADAYGIEGLRPVCFSGNFFGYSHAFSVVTTDAELIRRIGVALKANMMSDAYRKARYERIEERNARRAREQAFLSRAR